MPRFDWSKLVNVVSRDKSEPQTSRFDWTTLVKVGKPTLEPLGSQTIEPQQEELKATSVDTRTRNLLDMIGNLESPKGYNIAEGGKDVDLDQMTIDEVLEWQRGYKRRGSNSSAVGRYQFIRSTLMGLRNRLKLRGDEKFTPELQDRLAEHLLHKRGYNKYVSGKMTAEEFANSLAKEWASLPVVSGEKAGRSYYSGVGYNKALTDPESVLAQLQQE